MAVSDAHVWLAGFPGSVIWHSADRGSSWQRQSTGVNTPLRRIHFVDPRHGWAVGELGVIVRTVDGGARWEIVRGDQRRAAVLALVSQIEDAPWETLARLAADEGYRTVVHAISDPGAASAAEPRDRSLQWEEAVRQSGGHAASMAWQFAPPDRRLGLSPAAMFEAIDARNDGTSESRLRYDLVRRIRAWRPDAVLLPAPRDSADRPLDARWHAIASQAIAEAADPTSHLRLATEWGLGPWEVSRSMACLPTGARGTHHIDVQQPGRRLRRPLYELAEVSRRITAESTDTLGSLAKRASDIQEFQFISGVPPAQVDDLMSGLQVSAGGPARRSWITRDDEGDALLHERQLQRRRNLRALLQSSATSQGWLAQVAKMAADLPPAAAGSLLSELAEGFAEQGDLPLAAQVRQTLANQYPSHPLTPAAVEWLVQFYASSETARAFGKEHAALLREPSHTAPGPSSDVALASVQTPAGGGADNLTSDQRRAFAARLVDRLAGSHPLAAERPQVRFPWAASQRLRGFPGTAERYLMGWERRSSADPWQNCAAAERWLREPGDEPPALPIVHCRAASTPPHLDGQLTDAAWQSTSPAKLRSVGETSQPDAGVRFAYDREFLYLAIECRQATGVAYPVETGARPRDSDLSAFDRIRVALDLDRDYTTFYELCIDSRGRPADRCFHSPHWNPTWYIAARAGRLPDGHDA
ncbi:MAG: hypothetical protein KDA61_09865, partial [Planctomycetales bacterium]|nr:hypothetical protein [Planctomycetales bacterium]